MNRAAINALSGAEVKELLNLLRLQRPDRAAAGAEGSPGLVLPDPLEMTYQERNEWMDRYEEDHPDAAARLALLIEMARRRAAGKAGQLHAA